MAPSTAISSALEQRAVLKESKPSVPSPTSGFLIRPMTLSDTSILAEQSRQAYWLSPMNNWLAPRAIDHPEQLTRQLRQNLRRRYCDTNTLFLVASPVSNPTHPVGYAAFTRLGTGAKKYIRDKGLLLRLYLYILSWIFHIYHKLELYLSPDTIFSSENAKTFAEWIIQDTKRYWTPYPERKERWHLASAVVAPEWQGKGVGRLLVGKGLEEARREGVPCSCVASTHGEYLYRKLGFEYLGDFTNRVEGEMGEGDEGGGIMCWFPEGWEGRRAE